MKVVAMGPEKKWNKHITITAKPFKHYDKMAAFGHNPLTHTG